MKHAWNPTTEEWLRQHYKIYSAGELAEMMVELFPPYSFTEGSIRMKLSRMKLGKPRTVRPYPTQAQMNEEARLAILRILHKTPRRR